MATKCTCENLVGVIHCYHQRCDTSKAPGEDTVCATYDWVPKNLLLNICEQNIWSYVQELEIHFLSNILVTMPTAMVFPPSLKATRPRARKSMYFSIHTPSSGTNCRTVPKLVSLNRINDHSCLESHSKIKSSLPGPACNH